MKIYDFGWENGTSITQYGSQMVVANLIMRSTGDASVVVMRVDVGGFLGNHQAVANQLFMVLQGSGVVKSEKDGEIARPIHAGQAAFWVSGEWHETQTDSGLTAVIIEGDGLDPSQWMKEVSL